MEVPIDLEYESLYDEALEMSRTLKAIDRELRDAATCEGDYAGGYPPSQLLPNLCKIMYAHHPYWSSDRYVLVPGEVNKTESKKTRRIRK